MSPIFAIARKETGLCFRSVATWFAFALVALAFTPRATDAFARLAPFLDLPVEAALPVFFHKALFLGPFVCVYFSAPLFTREKSNGTLETLLTAPVTDTQVVLGKALSACICSGLALAVATVAASDAGAIAAPLVRSRALLGALIVLGLFTVVWNALGVLLGVLCRRTASVSFFALLPSLALSVAAVLTKDAPWSVFRPLDGIADSRPVVALVSIAVFLLFCAVRLLEARRWARAR